MNRAGTRTYQQKCKTLPYISMLLRNIPSDASHRYLNLRFLTISGRYILSMDKDQAAFGGYLENP